jgi:tetratricopeptide (TPR) repeat protein
MSEQQVISTGLEALKLIAAGGIGAAIIGVIGKLVVDRKLQEQKHKYDKQIEPLKSELQRKNTIHKLQFEKEFNLYEELWKALVAVRKTAVITPTLDNNMPKDKLPYDVYRERYYIALDVFNKAKNLFEDHRPFYHDDVSRITKDLLHQCRGYIVSVGEMLGSGKFDDKLEKEADKLLEKVPEAINEIEEAIKRRIGLLREAEIVE